MKHIVAIVTNKPKVNLKIKDHDFHCGWILSVSCLYFFNLSTLLLPLTPNYNIIAHISFEINALSSTDINVLEQWRILHFKKLTFWITSKIQNTDKLEQAKCLERHFSLFTFYPIKL